MRVLEALFAPMVRDCFPVVRSGWADAVDDEAVRFASIAELLTVEGVDGGWGGVGEGRWIAGVFGFVEEDGAGGAGDDSLRKYARMDIERFVIYRQEQLSKSGIDTVIAI